ncbi:glycosyltransferase family 2 protein [Salegentibacter sp. JZCK2]|uniref:glycosyltransferase family 2 protein n=1 Tax=Salegentibacter tibetensis TaxID=2873600 RepID=UPI001CCEDC2A|nr:glycosyltransferase family 2 protein [Salegentibacter tibetensis]MBZ9728624.1 glycosyltransferase family 2 protein [Salegentibacter tibetensis]
MKKLPVTVIIPVKNEECNLPHCLKMLKDFDQVMVVDSYSKDQTVKIAEEFGVEIHQFSWDGKFPKKRNWVLRNLPINNEWVLFLDADEFLTEDFKQELIQKIKDASISGYWIPYTNYFMGKELRYGESFKKLALFKFGEGEYEKIDEDYWSHLDMEVHEHILVKGRVGKFKSYVVHNDYKNLEAYIKRHNAYSTWETHRFFSIEKNGFKGLDGKQLLKYRLIQLGLLPIFCFLGGYFLKLGFLDGIEGFYFAQYRASYFYQVQMKIKEIGSKQIKNTGEPIRLSLSQPKCERVVEDYTK